MNRNCNWKPEDLKKLDKHRYWTLGDFKDLEQVNNFAEIGEIALRVQDRMPKSIGQVCGPISTGGTGNREENKMIFSKTIERLSKQEILLYNQLPLEESMVRVITRLGKNYNPYDLLEDIYTPLFESGKIKEVYFIYGWESSQGSRWEHKKAELYNMKLNYLKKDFYKK